MHRWSLFALLLVTCIDVSIQKKIKLAPQTLSRGWGDDITWVKTYEDGLKTMKESKRPLMVIHHLQDCPHSQALKKAFVADKTIQKMAKSDFVMLNLTHETTDKNLAPDGHYVPRILFVDPSMTVRTDIVGKYSNSRYNYGPSDMALLAENMKKAKLLLHTEL
ncbi:anterior gradient 1 isoform X1 [Esox lucius]|nr:anterior gradient 1 precursor [Esox lucius]XP_010878147.1 anterior gradient 1 isoform X1 [Esox lucius]XP_019910032.1 anterior gradient 1 isoform X1 [Esox lucius]ACO13726.1 Anterior gradient protein 3 homolog precursor [Esox lucius]